MIPLRFSGFTIFQPTRPLRGATGGQGGILSLSPYFNPRAPCGARPWAPWNLLSLSAEFQPTRPLRGATVKLWPWIVRRNISTHAPLAGRDQQLTHPGNHLGEISTHAPLAGRDSKSVQITMHIFAITDKFQMLLHRMPPVRAFCSFLMQENHADFGCEPPK